MIGSPKVSLLLPFGVLHINGAVIFILASDKP